MSFALLILYLLVEKNSALHRKDIDGLRGISVLAVLIYHLNPSWLHGGFVGVDVFFVISGFLISSNLFKETENRSFSFAEFYRRRIRRILPAFYFMVTLTLLAAPFFMIGENLIELTDSATWASLFLSNHYFANRFDYFSQNTWEIPLTHTWSLAVEEQFYMLWPLGVCGLSLLKLSRRHWKILIVVLAAASFALSQWLLRAPQWEKAAYYLLISRAGELLVGVFLARWTVGRETKHKESTHLGAGQGLVANLGLLNILLACVLINTKNPFPGFIAFWPCLGAVMVLWGGTQSGSFAYKILSSRPLVHLGAISYSLYLVHWPILALCRYMFSVVKLSPLNLAISTLLIYLLSLISYYGIEQPFRRVSWSFKKTTLILWLLPSAIIVTASFSIAWTVKNSDQFSAAQAEAKRDVNYAGERFCMEKFEGDCRNGKLSAKTNTLMFGDSQAGQYMAFWEEIATREGFSIRSFSVSSCYPLLDVAGHVPSTNPSLVERTCPLMLKKVLADIDHYENIILAGAWVAYFRDSEKPHFAKDLEATVRFLSDRGKNVFIMENIPIFSRQEFNRYLRGKHVYVKNLVTGISVDDVRKTMVDVSEINSSLEALANKYKNVVLIRPISALNDERTFLPLMDDELMYRDAEHLNDYGSRKIANRVWPAVKKDIQTKIPTLHWPDSFIR